MDDDLTLYPESGALFGADLSGALLPWLITRRIEGRLGHIPLEFSAAGYFLRNPDVAEAWSTNPTTVFHRYWLYGINEVRTFDDLSAPMIA